MVALAKVFFSKLHRFQTLRGVSFEQHIFREGLYLQETGYPAVLFPNDKDNFVESRNWICQISQHLVFSAEKPTAFRVFQCVSTSPAAVHRNRAELGMLGDLQKLPRKIWKKHTVYCML